MPKLTQTFADTVETEELDRPVFHWDSSLKGFGLKVTAGGARRWVFQYSDPKRYRRYRRLTIGDAAKIPAARARDKALRMAAAVSEGADPAQERQAGRRGLTLAQLSERYLVEHAQQKKKQASASEDERLFRRCILPTLGSVKVSEIDGADIRKLHHSLRKTPVQANRVLAVLSKVFRLAEDWGLRPPNTNPAKGIAKFRERRRQRFLSGEELARLGAVLSEAERDNSGHPSALLALRLLLLTGARRAEILNLRWAEVNLERGCLELSDSKTGAKTVRLGAPALRLISDAPRIDGNPFVCFGDVQGKPFVGLQKAWERLRKRSGLEDVRIHDLRHSFASVGAGGGLGLPILGALLGHSEPSTTHRYAHLSADPLRQAAEAISQEIAAGLEGKAGQVLDFTKRKT